MIFEVIEVGSIVNAQWVLIGINYPEGLHGIGLKSKHTVRPHKLEI